MINDNVGRWIEGEELKEFTRLMLNERLRWVREELNKIYIGEYSVKKVAADSGIISHMGLYKMESNSVSLPRSNKLQALADYYRVPVSIFSAHQPERFYLGKQTQKKPKNFDIRRAHHLAEISIRVLSPDGDKLIDEMFTAKMRFMDAEELHLRIKNEIDLGQRRLSKQRKLDEAFDILTKKGETND